MARARRLSPPLQRFLSRQIPYWSTIGMEVARTGRGTAAVRVRYGSGLLNANGVVHGGVIFSAADAAVAVALLSLLKAGARIATIEMKINFIRPAAGSDIVAEAAILHCGTRTALGEAAVRDGEGRLVAKALATYAVSAETAEAPAAPGRAAGRRKAGGRGKGKST